MADGAGFEVNVAITGRSIGDPHVVQVTVMAQHGSPVEFVNVNLLVPELEDEEATKRNGLALTRILAGQFAAHRDGAAPD